MKRRLIKIITIVGVIAVIAIGIYTYMLIKTTNYLNSLTYDIVKESYDNCGDYSKSKYQDIVSERFYKSMNYLHESERVKKDDLYIYISNFTNPDTHMFYLDSAKTYYIYEIKFSIKGEDGYSYGKSHCTVTWKLDDDNVWRVSDFIDPP